MSVQAPRHRGKTDSCSTCIQLSLPGATIIPPTLQNDSYVQYCTLLCREQSIPNAYNDFLSPQHLPAVVSFPCHGLPSWRQSLVILRERHPTHSKQKTLYTPSLRSVHYGTRVDGFGD